MLFLILIKSITVQEHNIITSHHIIMSIILHHFTQKFRKSHHIYCSSKQFTVHMKCSLFISYKNLGKHRVLTLYIINFSGAFLGFLAGGGSMAWAPRDTKSGCVEWIVGIEASSKMRIGVSPISACNFSFV